MKKMILLPLISLIMTFNSGRSALFADAVEFNDEEPTHGAMITCSNRYSDAVSYWDASYEKDYFKINVEVHDDDLYLSEADYALNDNIEFLIQVRSNQVYYTTGKTLDVVVCPKSIETYFTRYANTSRSWGPSIKIENFKVNYSYTSEETDGFDGYFVECKIPYEALFTTREDALGLIQLSMQMRNSHSSTISQVRTCIDFENLFSQMIDAPIVLEDGTFVQSFYNLPDIEKELTKYVPYKETIRFANVSCEKRIKQIVNGNSVYSDNQEKIDSKYMPNYLLGKSYFYSKKSDCFSYTIIEDGFIVLITPCDGSNSFVNDQMKKEGFIIISKEQVPTFSSYLVDAQRLEDNVNYYVKWCRRGESHTVYSWTMVISETLDKYDLFQTEECALKFILASDPIYSVKYRNDTRLYEACPKIIETDGPNGSKRLWSLVYSGGAKEPDYGNYITIYYSDNDGEDWIKAFFVSVPVINTQNRVGEYVWFLGEDGSLVFLVQQMCIQEFSDFSISYTGKLLNPWIPLNDTDDLQSLKFQEFDYPRIYDIHDAPIRLNDGSLIVGGQDMRQHFKVPILSSNDDGCTWTKIGEIYSPNASRFHECTMCQLPKRGPNSLMAVVRTNTSYFDAVSYSDDGGKTWTVAKEMFNMGSGTQPKLLTLPDGNIIFAHHYFTMLNSGGSRDKLCLFLSTDSGETWKKALIFDDRKNVTYPFLFLCSDESIIISWDHERYVDKECLWTRITENDLLNASDDSPDKYPDILDTDRIKLISTIEPGLTTFNLRITGTITNEFGMPIANATVRLDEARSVITDENGKYLFVLTNNDYRDYELLVSAQGYENKTFSVVKNDFINFENLKVVKNIILVED